MKYQDTVLKKSTIVIFTGNETTRRTITYPVGTKWVMEKSSVVNDEISDDYWTCVPCKDFNESDWKGCSVREIANMMFHITIPNVVGLWGNDFELTTGPELMRQFNLNGRVLICMAEDKKTFMLSQIALITLVDDPNKVMMTRQLFHSPMGADKVLGTMMGWEDLGSLPFSGRSAYWYLLPKREGAKVWKELREYANSLYEGKPADCPYELSIKFDFDDLSDIPTIVMKQQEFVRQFGVVPGKTLQLN